MLWLPQKKAFLRPKATFKKGFPADETKDSESLQYAMLEGSKAFQGAVPEIKAFEISFG